MIYTLTLIHWYNSYQVQLVVQAAPEAPSNRPMISKITSRWRWWSTRWWCWWWWWWWCRKISFKPAKKLAHWWCQNSRWLVLCSNSYKLSFLPATTHESLSTLLNNFYLAASIYNFQSFIFNVLQPSTIYIYTIYVYRRIYDGNCWILLIWRWHSDSNLVNRAIWGWIQRWDINNNHDHWHFQIGFVNLGESSQW